MSYLVDTDVFSEPIKKEAERDRKVVAWLRAHEGSLYISAVTLAEVIRGIEGTSGHRREKFQRWLDTAVRLLRGRILSFDRGSALAWGQLWGELDRDGRSMPLADSLIAASARANRLTLATRNTGHFDHAGVDLVNPFEVF